MKPKVSICVPNLNTRPFLPDRFESIFQQSYQNWELLVYDSYSEDGAWDYICKLASREPRMRAWQGPREGTPGSWSPCIRRASGKYVYVATSDDTMAIDCIEKLTAALEQHPDCDLAHCLLKTIDANGNECPNPWSQHSTFAKSSGPLLHHTHIRRAPFDGLLHLSGEIVYMSITQLLIRRSLFERIGEFSGRWGSVGDFHWEMRAGLVANTIHVPDTWGGFRMHPIQATAAVNVYSAKPLPQHRGNGGGRIKHMWHLASPEGGVRPSLPLASLDQGHENLLQRPALPKTAATAPLPTWPAFCRHNGRAPRDCRPLVWQANMGR